MNPVKDLMLAQDRIKQLEDAIRDHRSQKADDRCIEDDDRLYAVLNDGIKCDRRVGSKEEMLKNCARYIDRRCAQGHWPTYAELERDRDALKRDLETHHKAFENESKALDSARGEAAMLRSVLTKVNSCRWSCVPTESWDWSEIDRVLKVTSPNQWLEAQLSEAHAIWRETVEPMVSKSESDATLRERKGWIAGLAKVDVLGADANDDRVAQAVKEHDVRLKAPLLKMIERLREYAKHPEYPEGDPAIVSESGDLLRAHTT